MPMQSIVPRQPDPMPPGKMKECLALLRQADTMLIESEEAALACHLSLVIELLADRLKRD
jgi:hypothetical protein